LEVDPCPPPVVFFPPRRPMVPRVFPSRPNTHVHALRFLAFPAPSSKETCSPPPPTPDMYTFFCQACSISRLDTLYSVPTTAPCPSLSMDFSTSRVCTNNETSNSRLPGVPFFSFHRRITYVYFFVRAPLFSLSPPLSPGYQRLIRETPFSLASTGPFFYLDNLGPPGNFSIPTGWPLLFCLFSLSAPPAPVLGQTRLIFFVTAQNLGSFFHSH